VYSITDGTVTKIKTLKTGDGHLYGTSIEILGRGEYPTIFYCNLSGVKVRVGNKIHVGEKLGKVAQSPDQMGSYLHVALPFGKYISSLIQSDGSIKGSDSEVTVNKPKEKDTIINELEEKNKSILKFKIDEIKPNINKPKEKRIICKGCKNLITVNY
jgi:hypothetical protein